MIISYRFKPATAAAGGRLAALAMAVATLASPAASADLHVVATIKPIHSLVAGVMGDRGRPSVLIEGLGSPHSFALRPSQARELQRADVVFRVSPLLEPFTVRIAASLPKRVRLVSLADAPGLALLPMRTGATFPQHRHENGDAHAHAHAHGHGAKRQTGARDDTSAAAVTDPHVWLDPVNAKAMVGLIVTTLSARAPDDAAAFRANGEALVARLDALQTELARRLEPVKARPLVVFHDAYQYFERRFGLTVAGSVTANPEAGASARRLSDLRRRIAELGAVCLASEPQFSPRLASALVDGNTIRSAVLDPVGAKLPAGPDHYAATLTALADSVLACLSAR